MANTKKSPAADIQATAIHDAATVLTTLDNEMAAYNAAMADMAAEDTEKTGADVLAAVSRMIAQEGATIIMADQISIVEPVVSNADAMAAAAGTDAHIDTPKTGGRAPKRTADQILADTQAKAAEKAAKDAAREAEKLAKAPKPFALTPIAVDENGYAVVSMTELIPISSLPIEDAALCMRELSKSHVEHLTLAVKNGDTLPPLDVVGTSIGVAVVDGNHRWSAYETHTAASVAPENLTATRQASKLVVKPLNGLTERQIIQAAFSANLKNGLPMSDNSRSRYALWLVAEDRKNNPTAIGHARLSVPKAAQIAGVSHVAVYRMAQRIEASSKGKKMVDDIVGSAEDAQAARAQAAQDEADKKTADVLAAACQKMFTALGVVVKEVPDAELLAGYYNDNSFLKGQSPEELMLIGVSLQIYAENLGRKAPAAPEAPAAE